MGGRGVEEARRRAYLDAMGIQLWELNDREPARVASTARGEGESGESPVGAGEPPPWLEEAPPPEDDLEPIGAEPAVEVAVPAVPDLSGVDWPELERRVAECTLCDLHRTRTRAVFGVGDRDASVMVVGEAPGADEDRQGEPFVGRAGRLLDEMLFAAGHPRPTVFIANILKCRPPNNRDPRPEEVRACKPYLLRQIELVGPRVILAVGRVAAQNLLQTDARIGALRGRVHHLSPFGIPVVVTYHPAYLLRQPLEKRKAWEDLKRLRSLSREES
ncbi:MAG TPA: uracil-DNA glycosylase [Thiotrichales bacterium]|nr:uracil-DNA glycosylase [Thiotrichales bacterium]